MIGGDGRVAMVSGPARGLGRALAERLRADGYALSLGGRNTEAIETMVGEWQAADEGDGAAAGPATSIHHFDATDGDTARSWVDATVEAHGRIDVLVNNAGLLEGFTLDDYDEAAFDAMWQINVKAPTLLTHLTLPHLRAAGSGRVLNVASLSGKRVKGGFSPGYAMTKHAVMALTHATRQSAWADGVRAVALCPSFVDTEMIAHVDTGDEPVIDPVDLAELVSTTLALPDSASVAELHVNCRLEDSL